MRYYKHELHHPLTSCIFEHTEYILHQHPQIELSYVLSGKVTYTNPDTCYELLPGQLILHFPYELHAFSCMEPDSRMLTLLFDIDFLADFIRRFCEYRLPKKIFSKKELEASTHDALQWLYHYAAGETEAHADTVQLMQRGWLTAILGDLFYKHELKKRSEKLEPEIIAQIISNIEKQIDKNLTMEELAHASGISLHYLTHIKQYIFVTYNTLLTTTKISYADRLLVNTDSSLLEIAIACGYPNLTSFNRNYKKVTGMTPSDVRKRKNSKA